MVSDTQTQRDLEIFTARDQRSSIWTTIDRTVTRDGAQCLRAFLSSPLDDLVAIEERQRAIGFLHRVGFRYVVPDDLIRSVRSYVASSFVTLGSPRWLGRVVEALWISLRYRELLDHARFGVAAVRRMLALLRPMLAHLEREGAPSEIGRGCEVLRTAIARIEASLTIDDSSARAVLEADDSLRGELRAAIEGLLEQLARIDALACAARLLDEGYALPELIDDATPHLEGHGIWHPFLPGGVRNSIVIRGGETLVFLTGPNMAGKSTYLKAVGVCVYLGQCGLPIPATRFSFTPVDRLITGLTPEDNLREGVSYFLSEIRRVKEVLTAVANGERTLAIFDEVFRGTNVRDALEASTTVLTGCAQVRSSMFVFSSHLVELAQELEHIPSVRFCSFEGDLMGSELRFDYRLQPGVSNQRFGMELLRREGLPELLESIVS